MWFLQFSPYTEAFSFKEMSEDTMLTCLKHSLYKGYIPQADEDLKPYQKAFDNITVSDEGLLLKDDCIILLKSLWTLTVKKAYPGISFRIQDRRTMIRQLVGMNCSHAVVYP